MVKNSLKQIQFEKKKAKTTPIKTPAKVNIHAFLGDYQGCGSYRIIWPYMLLNHLRTPQVASTASYSPNFILDPKLYENMTFTVFQRAFSDQHLQIIKLYKQIIQKRTPVPILYEIDDLLFDIPETNYCSQAFKPHEESIKKIMNLCDGIIVSTDILKRIYFNYNEKIVVNKNRLPRFLFNRDIIDNNLEQGRLTNSVMGDKLRIMYPASQNHFGCDISKKKSGGDIGPVFIDYIRKTTDKYNWVFIGGRPPELVDLFDNGKIEYHKWRNILEYPQFIRTIKGDIGIAPLENNLFNKCKSNLKLLEYTQLGIPGIFQNLEPYNEAVLKAKSDEQFINLIEKVDKDRDLLFTTWYKQYNIFKDGLFFEENNNLVKFLSNHFEIFNQYIEHYNVY